MILKTTLSINTEIKLSSGIILRKRILKPCLTQESDISTKGLQACFSDPFSLTT